VFDPVTAFIGPWGIETDNGRMLDADYNRVDAAPKFGSREVWHLVNGGGGWVAYCPMAQRYWVQRGTEIRNLCYGSQMLD
jgi:hypothetical protein